MKRKPYLILVLLLALCFAGCDNNRLIDLNVPVPEGNWYSQKPVTFTLPITDTLARYNVYLNLRISADYRYSNLFVLFTIINPAKEINRQRVEVALADQSGKWLGKGLGDIFTYQERVYSNIEFAKAGEYQFEIEQNMRTEKLAGVLDVGIRVEKAD